MACGGFAAEFYLLDKGLAERGPDDERDISQIVFHNATGDREDFWGRKLGRDEAFTKAEDEEFMHPRYPWPLSSTITFRECRNLCASFSTRGGWKAGE